MSGIAAGIGVASLAAGLIGSHQSAQAAKGAANAQKDAAVGNASSIKKLGLEAMDLARATPQELAALDRAYTSAENALTREEKLISAIDPAIMEASKQALSLLRGGDSAAQAPIMQMRNAQRERLMASLRSQYGPGAEFSSIGQQALNQFDMETGLMQQQVLGNLFQMGTTDVGGRLSRGIGTLQTVGQGYSGLQDRLVNTKMGTAAALGGANQAVIQTAGAPFTGQALQGQGLASLGNNMMGTASTFGMMQMMGNKPAGGTNSFSNPINPNALTGSQTLTMGMGK